MAFWNISDGVNRHSSCGNRIALGKNRPPELAELACRKGYFNENNMDTKSVRQCIAAQLLRSAQEEPRM